MKLTIKEWHCFLDRYKLRVSIPGQQEYSRWLREFEREHGEQARQEYEERRLIDG